MSIVPSRFAFLLALPLLAAACRTGSSVGPDTHWTEDSVPQRIAKHFTGYREDLDGKFIDYQYQKKMDISRTLRRVFLNNSPDNPFEADDPTQTQRRPPHSLAPDPLYYIGVEGIVSGFVMMGISGGFVPIPVDSLIATFTGGGDEFWGGFSEGSNANALNPPSVSQFKVKNR